LSDIENHIKWNLSYRHWRELAKVQADARGFFDRESEWGQTISAISGAQRRRRRLAARGARV
jgi:hypothetical protein